MSWLALVTAALRLLGSLTSWLHDRQMISAGAATQAAEEMRKQADGLRQATEARESARTDAATRPEHLRDNDGFRRD